MAYGYVVSKEDLSITDVFFANDYAIALDKEYAGKSTVNIAKCPKISEGDFLFLKRASGAIFHTGVVDFVSTASDAKASVINLIEKENIFNRKIILSGESSISETGIEDFIVNTINSQFINSEDSFLNMPYIEVEALTHTKIAAAVKTENGGIYNFMTYLGNAREYYGIFLDFEFTGTKLKITVSKKDQSIFKIDASVTDVTNYVEDYSVENLAKLTVKWEPSSGGMTILQYFLLTNRTISTDINNPNRAKGSVDCIYVQSEKREEVEQAAIDKFTGNSYEHSVTADFRRESKLYPEEEFYVGHKCQIKTKGYGVRDSFIYGVSYSKNSTYLSVKFGNMAITLIEKLRKERKGT